MNNEKEMYELIYTGIPVKITKQGEVLKITNKANIELTDKFPHITKKLNMVLKKDVQLLGTICLLDRHQKTHHPITEDKYPQTILKLQDIINTEPYYKRKQMLQKIWIRNTKEVQTAWHYHFLKEAMNRVQKFNLQGLKVINRESQIKEPYTIIENIPTQKHIFKTTKPHQVIETMEGKLIKDVPFQDIKEILYYKNQGRTIIITSRLDEEKQQYIGYEKI